VVGLAAAVIVEAATIGVLAGVLAKRPSPAPVSAITTSSPGGRGITATSTILPKSGQIVFSSTFRATDDWRTGQVQAHATAHLRAAGYVVTGWGDYDHALTPPMAEPHPSISVTVTSNLPPSSDAAGPQCVSGSQPDIYEFDVGANGDWFATARLNSVSLSGPPEILQSGSVGLLHAPLVVELVCASIAQTKGVTETRLVGFIDGHQVMDTSSSSAGVASSGWQPGLQFSTYDKRGSITFTRYVVRSLGG
jgi:hypothetical protein